MTNPNDMNIALEQVSFFIYPIFFLVMLLGLLRIIACLAIKKLRRFSLKGTWFITGFCAALIGLYSMVVFFSGGFGEFWQHCETSSTWLFSLNMSLYSVALPIIYGLPLLFMMLIVFARIFREELSEALSDKKKNNIASH